MLARMSLVIALFVMLLGAVIAILVLRSGSGSPVLGTLVAQSIGQPVSDDPASVPFVVQPGDSALTVGTKLESVGLIRSALAFRLLVQYGGTNRTIKAGDYQLRKNQSLADIVQALTEGTMSGGLLTVPEGWRDLEIADALERNQITSRASFIQSTDHLDLPMTGPLQVLTPGSSVEGFLFPDSYRFEPNTPADQVVQQMLDDFQKQVGPDLISAFSARGLSLKQAVTLASIVEREAVVPTERPIIASVYLNRLHQGMRLQADPTVQYALITPLTPINQIATYWKSGLTLNDLKISSPYNTYVVTGLPAGPICNPGLASLQAVAQAPSTDYLYFVARPDGSHAFASTFQEQQQNAAKYQGQ